MIMALLVPENKAWNNGNNAEFYNEIFLVLEYKVLLPLGGSFVRL